MTQSLCFKRCMGPRLYDRLERLTLVRKRFRNQQPWLRAPPKDLTDAGEETEGGELTTKVVKWNAPILRAILQQCGLKKPSVKALKKEARPQEAFRVRVYI